MTPLHWLGWCVLVVVILGVLSLLLAPWIMAKAIQEPEPSQQEKDAMMARIRQRSERQKPRAAGYPSRRVG